MDIGQIKKNYRNFDDLKIETLAKNEAGSLDQEVIPILIHEIKKRNLNTELLTGIEAQTKELTNTELEETIQKIESLACPECGSNKSKLVGTLIRKVKSFVIVTNYSKTPIISCQSCADSIRKKALITTVTLGWWGVPWGLFKTPMALISTYMDNKIKYRISADILAYFSIENIGEIKTDWDNEPELISFIHHRNTQN